MFLHQNKAAERQTKKRINHFILNNMAKEVEAQENASANAAKLKALQATIDKIEKDYGKGTIMKLGDQPKFEVSVIPSGSIALDHALGIGGYPRGRVIEIYGPESAVRQPSQSMRLPRLRNRAESQQSSMRSTPLIAVTQRISA